MQKTKVMLPSCVNILGHTSICCATWSLRTTCQKPTENLIWSPEAADRGRVLSIKYSVERISSRAANHADTLLAGRGFLTLSPWHSKKKNQNKACMGLRKEILDLSNKWFKLHIWLHSQQTVTFVLFNGFFDVCQRNGKWSLSNHELNVRQQFMSWHQLALNVLSFFKRTEPPVVVLDCEDKKIYIAELNELHLLFYLYFKNRHFYNLCI